MCVAVRFVAILDSSGFLGFLGLTGNNLRKSILSVQHSPTCIVIIELKSIRWHLEIAVTTPISTRGWKIFIQDQNGSKRFSEI